MCGSDYYPFVDGKILTENSHKMKSYIAADKEFALYADMFFRTNAIKLFTY
jgi:hypothetical protein